MVQEQQVSEIEQALMCLRNYSNSDYDAAILLEMNAALKVH